MTLARQLIVIVSLLFLLVFVGTLVISVNNTRNYLAEQLRSHAQDTATSLGLSLVPPMARNDVTLMETMVNAIFDPGYYREIIIQKPDGSALIERIQAVRVEDVPAWFVRLIPIETPRATSEVMTNWRLAGRVVVSSHPGYAYRQLWLISTQTFWWFLGVLVIAIVLLAAVLRYVLAPLREVEAQALAICEREFPVLEKMPWTRELHRVVVAMNKMSTKVERMLGDQTELTEKMRQQANQDPVTGLANRRNFDARVNHLIESREEFQAGALFLMQLDGFKEYNDRHGFEAGDELLKEAATILLDLFESGERHVIARLGGGNFAVLACDITAEEAQEFGNKLGNRLSRLYSRGLSDGVNIGHIGIAGYEGKRTASELLSQADMALRAASRKGPNACHMYDAQALAPSDVHSAGQWLKIIRTVIDDHRIKLYFQPVVSCTDRAVQHYEALARIIGESGEPVSAGIFVPMAERHGLVQALDKVVVECMLQHLAEQADAGAKYAVNLFPGSVHDAEFVDWLCEVLAKTPGHARRLIFETPEYGAMTDSEAVRGFIARLRELGAEFSLDHFGVGFASFGYLRELKLDYIKVDGSYIHEVHRNKDNQFFVHALTDIAHGLDIRVIAESVEQREEWETLPALHVDAAQGYYLGRPETAIPAKR